MTPTGFRPRTRCKLTNCKRLHKVKVDFIFLYKLIVYIVLDYDYCVLYFATLKCPLALCCLINENEMKERRQCIG